MWLWVLSHFFNFLHSTIDTDVDLTKTWESKYIPHIPSFFLAAAMIFNQCPKVLGICFITKRQKDPHSIFSWCEQHILHTWVMLAIFHLHGFLPYLLQLKKGHTGSPLGRFHGFHQSQPIVSFTNLSQVYIAKVLLPCPAMSIPRECSLFLHRCACLYILRSVKPFPYEEWHCSQLSTPQDRNVKRFKERLVFFTARLHLFSNNDPF